jgi:hypothetical protein
MKRELYKIKRPDDIHPGAFRFFQPSSETAEKRQQRERKAEEEFGDPQESFITVEEQKISGEHRMEDEKETNRAADQLPKVDGLVAHSCFSSGCQTGAK